MKGGPLQTPKKNFSKIKNFYVIRIFWSCNRLGQVWKKSIENKYEKFHGTHKLE
jgi:hypothetical protein